MNGLGVCLLPPQQVLDKYNKVIKDYSEKYGTDSFDAHVTALPKMEGEKDHLVDRAARHFFYC